MRGNEAAPARKIFEEGRDLFGKAYALNPDERLEAGRLFCEGRQLTFNDNVDPAIPLLERAVLLQPEAAYAYNGLGIAYLKSGRYNQAAWSFRDAKLRAPHWIYPRHNLALTYMESGAYAAGEKSIERLWPLRDRPHRCTMVWGLLLQKTNRNKEAEVEYQRAVDLNPDFAGGTHRTGCGLGRSGARRTPP